MKHERYEVIAGKSYLRYEFVSDGPQGKINKAIEYTELTNNIYNLGFGDINDTTGEIDDEAVTNNGDTKKILLTVASSVYKFIDKYPDASIYITGNTKARTRLYRIGITNNLEEILIYFEILGLRNNGWEVFYKEVDYEAFLIKRKKINLSHEPQEKI